MRHSRKQFFVILLLLSWAVVGFAPPADEPSLQITETLPGRQVILRAEERVIPFHVPAPEQAQLGIQSATFTVNWNPSNCDGTVSSWPTNAKTAFNYALSIWGSLINSSVPIEVDACWRSDLGSGILGSAGATTIHGNFSGAPETYTWYPVALANSLYGGDLNSGDAEIEANFSSTFNWYYGTDGNAAWDEYDFASVVLHEVGHGLGFLGSGYVSGSLGYWGYSGYPIIYDHFTESSSGTAILSYTSGSTTLGSVLTSDNVFFDGPNANAANGGQRVELYAPTPWNSGSSYSHLAESFNGTENALMTYSLGWGESEHSPGPVTLGLFEDLGWSVNAITPPQPDLQISQTVIGSDFEPGDPVSFVLAIENIGDDTATAVVVTDTLPSDISFTSQSDTFTGAVTFNGCSPCTWDLPNLDPGDSGTITVNGQISGSLPDDFGLTNSVSISAAETESNLANNSSSAGIGTFYSYLPFIAQNYTTATLSAVELELFNLINTERTGRGLSPLSNSSLLNQVATAHSADMRDRDFFDHTNPDGNDPGDRLDQAGYIWSTYGETIGVGYTSAQAMFDGWMDSDGHRDILLSTSYTEIGMGYIIGGSWGHYWTAVTATPR